MHSLRYLDDDGLHKRMMETLSEYLYFLWERFDIEPYEHNTRLGFMERKTAPFNKLWKEIIPICREIWFSS